MVPLSHISQFVLCYLNLNCWQFLSRFCNRWDYVPFSKPYGEPRTIMLERTDKKVDCVDVVDSHVHRILQKRYTCSSLQMRTRIEVHRITP